MDFKKGVKMKKLTIPVLTVGMAVTSYSAVYIAPADIDSYKQKTDQSFYDLYQNPNSPIAKGVNPALKNFTNNISTKNKIAIGDTIIKVTQGVVQGEMIKNNTQTYANIPGLGRYLFKVDNYGNVLIYGKYATPDHKQVIKEGSYAKQVGIVRCIKRSVYRFSKYASASKCDEYERNAIEKNFNVLTGVYVQRLVEQKAPASCHCYSTGKYSGVCKCNPKTFNTTNTIKTMTQSINIADVLKNKQFMVASLSCLENQKIKNVENVYSKKILVFKGQLKNFKVKHHRGGKHD